MVYVQCEVLCRLVVAGNDREATGISKILAGLGNPGETLHKHGLQRGIQRLFIYLFKVYFKILSVAQTLEHWLLG